MFDHYAEQIRAGALAAYPNEAVWLITTQGCQQVENVAARPAETFRVAKLDMAAAQAAGLLAVVRSEERRVGKECER